MELIYVVIVLGAVQAVTSTPAIYNNDINKNSYSNYKYNSKFYPELASYKTSWSSNKKTIPIEANEYKHENEIYKFPFNLKSQYINNQEQKWNKHFKNVEKKDANPLEMIDDKIVFENEDEDKIIFKDEDEDKIVFEDELENEDASASTEDYENITITLSEEDLADRIDEALMCSLLGRCFEDQQ